MSETYKLPPEPAVGTVLRDPETRRYVRRTRTGWTAFLSERPPAQVGGWARWNDVLASTAGLVEVEPDPVTIRGLGTTVFVLSKTGMGNLALRDPDRDFAMFFTPERARNLAAELTAMAGE